MQNKWAMVPSAIKRDCPGGQEKLHFETSVTYSANSSTVQVHKDDDDDGDDRDAGIHIPGRIILQMLVPKKIF